MIFRPPLFRNLVVAGMVLAVGAATMSANGQSAVAPFPSASRSLAESSTPVPVPFAVGERLEYEVKFGSLKVGNGTMEVKEITEVRGRPAWHTVFTIRGGIPLYRVNDVYESWFDVVTLNSLRYHQDVDEGSYERRRRYEIFPERGMMREGDQPEHELPRLSATSTPSLTHFQKTNVWQKDKLQKSLEPYPEQLGP